MKKSWIIILVISFCFSCQDTSYLNSKITSKTIHIDSIISQDSLIIKTYRPFKNKMIKEVSTVISYAPNKLVRTDGVLQSSLGNLIADLSYEKATLLFKEETGKLVDFSMSNYGGIRSGISSGNVTVSHAFELMPFDNTIVVVELTANKVKELFDYFTKEQEAHPISKQVQITFNGNNYDVKIKGQKINKKKTYFVATTNYLQKGGDGMIFFNNPESLFESNYLVRNAIEEYFISKDTLISNLDKRVIIK